LPTRDKISRLHFLIPFQLHEGGRGKERGKPADNPLIKRRALGGRLRGEAWARYVSEAFRAFHFWIRDEGSAARGFSHAPPEPWSNLTLSI